MSSALTLVFGTLDLVKHGQIVLDSDSSVYQSIYIAWLILFSSLTLAFVSLVMYNMAKLSSTVTLVFVSLDPA